VPLSARSTPAFGLTGQALDDLSAKFIKFAQLNDTDVSTSIDNVSSVMNAFGMDASEADSLLDALNATGQATGIDMDTLAGALSSNAAS
jgi:phage-related minor tail protein